jgi:hypothetical protein
VAIVVAACSGQTLVDMLAMIRARLSIASGFGNPASLPASCHGSLPSRANTETTLRVMPFASVPIGAKRNSSSAERLKAKASELGMLNSQWNEDVIQDIVCRSCRYNVLRCQYLPPPISIRAAIAARNVHDPPPAWFVPPCWSKVDGLVYVYADNLGSAWHKAHRCGASINAQPRRSGVGAGNRRGLALGRMLQTGSPIRSIVLNVYVVNERSTYAWDELA